LLTMIQVKLGPSDNWNLSFGIFQLCIFAGWLVRDFLFLQWMALRRSRRALVAGVLYLLVFYVCTIGLFSTITVERHPRAYAFFAALMPGAEFGLSLQRWIADQRLWIAILIILFAEAFLFAWLQRRTLLQILGSRTSAAEPAPHPSSASLQR
jgi:hypothetical protein